MECMRNHFTQGALLDGRYKTVSPLNHGSFGLVFKALDVHTGEFVALKCLTKSTSATYNSFISVDERSEELAIHRHIGPHPNIVNLLHHFETQHHVYLVLEYCTSGDLYESIRAGSSPKETERIRESLLQLIDAVDYMHSRGVYHRDIKPENIFLSEDRSLKLGDFGLATRDVVSTEAAVGSDRYMAPEQMDPTLFGYSPAKADVWAIGICLLNLLFSRNPFASPSFSDPLFADFAADRQALFDIFPSMSQDTFEILVQCLAIDPENRSLNRAREAVCKAVCFTTEDETIDELDLLLAPVVTATANREPLRTPSITSPQLDHSGAFPWAKNLALTAPTRQLSAIADEDLFGTHDSWDMAKSHPDNASFVSFVDSGLGVSVKSEIDDVKRSKAMPICGSLPAMARTIPGSSLIGTKREFQSKSWSEIFKDDDESDFEFELDNDSAYFRSSEDLPASNDSNGSDTPRAALTELKTTPNVQTSVQDRKSEELERGLFDFEHEDSTAVKRVATPTMQRLFSPAKKAAIDKWAQLGDKRRETNTPVKKQSEPLVDSQTPKPTTPMTIPWRKRDKTTPVRATLKQSPTNWTLWAKTQQSWPIVKPQIMNKEWNISQDWRKRLMSSSMADDRLLF